MNPLHSRTIIVWWLGALLLATVLVVAAGLVEALVLAPEGIVLVTRWTLPGAVFLLGFAFGLGWPVLSYRAWRWKVDADRVLIQKGVLWRSRSVIPRVRIQHVDTRTNPLQRWLGLSTLTLYTAGTRGADVSIPGLATDEAEALREELAHLDELERDG